LLRFAHKTSKTRRLGGFLPCKLQGKLPSTPDNRDFCVTDGAKIHKCNRFPGLHKLWLRLTGIILCGLSPKIEDKFFLL
jgi:hypothetical protein